MAIAEITTVGRTEPPLRLDWNNRGWGKPHDRFDDFNGKFFGYMNNFMHSFFFR